MPEDYLGRQADNPEHKYNQFHEEVFPQTKPETAISYFLREGEKMEGVYPGFPEMITRFKQEQLGRAITVARYRNGSLVQEAVVGYILPADRPQSSHLVVLENGTVMMLTPSYRSDVNLEVYQSFFSPSETGFEYRVGPDDIRDNEELVNLIERGFEKNEFKNHSTVIYKNNRRSDSESITSNMKGALKAAKQLKEDREREKQLSADEILHIAEEFLKSNHGQASGGEDTPNSSDTP